MRISDWSSYVCSSDLDVAETDRIAIAVGDDQWPIGGRVGELGAGLQGHGLTRAVDLADRDIGVGGGQRVGDIVEADAGCRDRLRIDLDAYGIFLGTIDQIGRAHV